MSNNQRNPRFRNGKNRLTHYALTCGLVEKQQLDSVKVSLSRENKTFHVRAVDDKAGERLFWESFTKLSDARDMFDNADKVVAVCREG